MRRYLPEALIFVVGLTARLTPEIAHGSMTGNYGYDASVYYAAADAFVHGRMPYRDFVLLHPPGIVLADSPFALFGIVTGDTAGFAAATLAFAALGALNAVLVCRVAQRLGLPRRAAIVGGIVYALWFGAIGAEYLARLEPLGSFLLLCGLLAVLRARAADEAGDARRSTVYAVLSGLALGSALSVKVWWVGPAVVIIGWQLIVDRAPARAVRMAAGALIAVVALDVPFFLAAPGTMWRMVVLDQLGRPVDNVNPLRTFGYLTIGGASQNASHAFLTTAVAIGAAVVAVLAWRSWRFPAARLIVVIFVLQLVQIAVEPSWFTFYADFVTVALALLVAAGVSRAPTATQRAASWRRNWIAAGSAAALAISLFWTLPRNLLATFPAANLAKAAEPYRCVMSDSPMALIDMNVLSRDFHNGCPNLVDVTGLVYDLMHSVKRSEYEDRNRVWNADMRSYLRSGDAVIFVRRPDSIGITPSTVRAVERDGMLVDDQGLALYRVRRTVSAPVG